MDPWLVPLVFVIANAAERQRAALVQRLVLTALPGPNSLRLTFAAIDAERQLASQATADEQVLRDAVRAAGFQTAESLAEFPALQRLFDGLSENVKATIFPTASRFPTTTP
jgi:hypothetical protein